MYVVICFRGSHFKFFLLSEPVCCDIYGVFLYLIAQFVLIVLVPLGGLIMRLLIEFNFFGDCSYKFSA